MSNLYEKLPCKEGSRPYKCVEFGTKVSLKLNNLRKDGRFCDIDLISGTTKVKVSTLLVYCLLNHIVIV